MHKRSKDKPSFSAARTILIFVIVLAIIVVSTVSLFVMYRQNISSSLDETSVVRGKITEKRVSCGREILTEDGRVENVGGICDGGNALTVDGVSVSTGGGALVPLPVYVSNIEFLDPGDVVEIRYVEDENGYKNTNCKSCYVKKSGSFTPEAQMLIKQ